MACVRFQPLNFLAPVLRAAAVLCALAGLRCTAQIDPIDRNLVEVGYDQPLVGHGPNSEYAYYYFNRPDYIGDNIALRAVIAPGYMDSELGFKGVAFPYTDFGIGLTGGAFGDNYYAVKDGRYLQTQSFYGSGGGTDVSLYQLLNPGMKIPLTFVARVGMHYATYFDTEYTSSRFKTPPDQLNAYTRLGLRLAGSQPLLFPALGLELSAWYERERHFYDDPYGFDGDLRITPATDLYWMVAALNYTSKENGDALSFRFTAGGSTGADPLNAWRLGGVLPLASEFPLEIPGYYYEELTATRFAHFYSSYSVPLDERRRWDLRFDAAAAHITYLPGFKQSGEWQSGVGTGLAWAPNKTYKVILRYGYGFDAIRNGKKGAQSTGILFQYDFNAHKEPKDAINN